MISLMYSGDLHTPLRSAGLEVEGLPVLESASTEFQSYRAMIERVGGNE